MSCRLIFAAALIASCAASAADGVSVGAPSALRNLVPAAQLEQQSASQYAQMLQQASLQHALATDSNRQLIRLRRIASRIIAHADRFNPAARNWQWRINLIRSTQLNAFCMPGGKIAVYSGLIDELRLTDDEIAIVLSHEIAHALREHARSRIAKGELTQIGASLLGQKFGDGRYSGLFQAGGSLLTLKFSRSDETDADLVGLELAARAGFDPRAGITLWRKMTQANRNAPPQWLSTHPSGANREEQIRRHLPEVLPLYQASR